MKSMLIFVGFHFSLVGCAQGADPKPTADGTMALLGSWKVVKFDSNGKAKDEPIGAIVTFDGKTMAVKLPGDDKEEGSYRLDTTKTPKHLDLTVLKDDKPRMHENIYKIEGKTLIIVFNERRQPRPTKFDVGEGDNYERIELTRVASDPKKP
jgi:uncharacterized protein (TIGR03067 family)